MAREPRDLLERLRDIEQQLDDLAADELANWATWEHVTLPLLSMLAATPAHRVELQTMVDGAERDLLHSHPDRMAHQFRRRFALLRAHLVEACGVPVDPTI